MRCVCVLREVASGGYDRVLDVSLNLANIGIDGRVNNGLIRVWIVINDVLPVADKANQIGRQGSANRCADSGTATTADTQREGGNR